MKERRTGRPKSCEFSEQTKLEALNRSQWQCEDCGIKKKDTPEGFLHIHHKLGIATALYRYPELSHALIASINNALVTCVACHKKRDREDPKKHRQYYQELTSMKVRQLQLEFAIEE